MVQESYLVKSCMRRWKNEWGGQIRASHFSSSTHGVLTLFRKGANIEIVDSVFDDGGRLLITRIKYNSQMIALVNIYAPNEDNPQFFVDIFEKISKIEADQFIMGGDFNKTLEEIDRKTMRSSKEMKTQSAMLIKEYLDEFDWVYI